MSSPWVLLAIPATWAALAGVLAMSAAVERRILSPRALVLRAARMRSNSPEHAESLVAAQYERLLRDIQR